MLALLPRIHNLWTHQAGADPHSSAPDLNILEARGTHPWSGRWGYWLFVHDHTTGFLSPFSD